MCYGKIICNTLKTKFNITFTYLSAKYPNTVTATKIPATNTDLDMETNHCRSHTKSHY